MRNMKRAISLLIALVTVAAFMVVPAFAAAITTTPKVGVPLEAPSSAESHQWYIHTTNTLTTAVQVATTATEIDGATDETYTPVAGDVGKYLYCVIDGSLLDGPSPAVQAADEDPGDEPGGDGFVDPATLDEPTFDDYAKYYGYIADETEDSAYIGTVGSAISIDFNKEIIYYNSTPAEGTAANFYTVDGSSWKQMKFSISESREAALEAGANADFAKAILDKGAADLQFTSALGPEKTPAPAVGKVGEDGYVAAATTYKGGLKTISARPKIASFKPNYAPTGLTQNIESANGAWLPTQDKDTTQTAANLQIAFSSDKKTPALGTYGKIDTTAGIRVLDYETKPVKTVYLVRTAPKLGQAASKAKKLSVSSVIKAPNLKVDYKKGIIKFKAGMVWGTVELGTDDDGAVIPLAVNSFDQLLDTAKATVKGDALTSGMPLTTLIGEEDAKSDLYGKNLGIRLVGTAKKPASKIQPISVQDHAPIYESATAISAPSKGVKISLPKGYEAALASEANKPETKWKTSIKAETKGVYAVRIKNTAKFSAKTNTTSGNVTSGYLLLDVALTKDAKDKDLAIPSFIQTSGSYTSQSSADLGVYAGAATLTSTIAIKESTENTALTKVIPLQYAGETTYEDYDLVSPFVDDEDADTSADDDKLTAEEKMEAAGIASIELGEDGLTIVATKNVKKEASYEFTFKAKPAEEDEEPRAEGADAGKYVALTVNVTVDNKSFVTAVKADIKAAIDALVDENKDETQAEILAAITADALEDACGDYGVTATVTITKTAPTETATGTIEGEITYKHGDYEETGAITKVTLPKVEPEEDEEIVEG